MRYPTRMAASYFDVDGTLVKTNLFDTLMFYVTNQQHPFLGAKRLAQTVASIPALFAAEQVDRGTFNEGCSRAMRASPRIACSTSPTRPLTRS